MDFNTPSQQATAPRRVICRCERKCGGPDGAGVYLSYSAYRKHLRKNADHLAQRVVSGITPSASSNLSQSQYSSASFNPPVSQLPRRQNHQPNGSQLREADSQEDIHIPGGEFHGQDPVGGIDENEFGHETDLPRSAASNRAVEDVEQVDPGSLADQNRDSTHNDAPEHVDPNMSVNSADLRNNNPRPDEHAPEEFEPNFLPHLDDIKITLSFVELLRNATLDDELEPLDKDFVCRLRNPPTSPLNLNDRDTRLSIELFLANSRTSEDTYTESCQAIMRAFPEARLLSLHDVKKRVEEITGVVAIWRDMCPKGCIGFTGPFAKLDYCTWCGESRYQGTGNKRVARLQYPTMSVGPMLQALNRTPEGALAMEYRTRYTQQLLGELRDNDGVRQSPFRDFFDGSDYLQGLRDAKIGENDICLMMSIDGAQLYRNKASDCWMWIWVILDLDPSGRYKVAKVIPGGSIPGPNKPKHLDSFIFSSLYHFVALAREGLKIWKANRDILVSARLFLALVSADGPGMACLNGLVGHQGRIHCRSFCGILGRHKEGHSHYYPVRLKPYNFSVPGSSHADVDLFTLLASLNSRSASQRYYRNLEFVVNSPNKTQFEKRRLETGICKPSIFSGFPKEHILGIPHIFSSDIMHLPCLNIPDLMIPLWRGKFECDKTDSVDNWPWACFRSATVWKSHGEDVANCTPYLPGSFDRPPRNPAEKISSGYKAWEFLLYFYALGPCLFYGHLPTDYWKSYCRLVRSIQISLQEEISVEENNMAFDLCSQFSNDFENMYYQRRAGRIHMIRPAIHAISHIALDTSRIGPGIIYSQWTMERMIGVLGDLIMQPSNPYANLAARMTRLAQINVLKAIDPSIQTELKSPRLPRGAKDLGDGYTLRRAMDTAARPVSPPEMQAIRMYLRHHGFHVDDTYQLKITRWARVGLPNGQIARSRWKEELKPLDRVRMARNVQIMLDSKQYICEVHFYLSLKINEVVHDVAIGSFYGPPHADLYQASSGTYITMQHFRDIDVRVFSIKSISAVVMMAPDPRYPKFFQDGSEVGRYFMASRPGLKILQFIGIEENDTEE